MASSSPIGSQSINANICIADVVTSEKGCFQPYKSTERSPTTGENGKNNNKSSHTAEWQMTGLTPTNGKRDEEQLTRAMCAWGIAGGERGWDDDDTDRWTRWMLNDELLPLLLHK